MRVGVEVREIARAGNSLQVTFVHEGREQSLTADRVANGTGRIADVDDLDLAAAEIAHDGLTIAVDDHLRSTSNPDVYVAGDALTSSAQLSPLATYEGRLVGANIVEGDTQVPRYDHVPSAVYAVPALATVGLTEEEAAARGLAFQVKTNDMRGWRSARTYAETVAFAKVLVEDGSNRILGAHMVGHGAEEVIHLFAMAITHGIPAGDIASAVYAYPTFMSDATFLV